MSISVKLYKVYNHDQATNINVLYSMIASQQEILTALLFEKVEQFENICNPPLAEGEVIEDGAEPQKPDFQFRDNFGKFPFTVLKR